MTSPQFAEALEAMWDSILQVEAEHGPDNDSCVATVWPCPPARCAGWLRRLLGER